MARAGKLVLVMLVCVAPAWRAPGAQGAGVATAPSAAAGDPAPGVPWPPTARGLEADGRSPPDTEKQEQAPLTVPLSPSEVAAEAAGLRGALTREVPDISRPDATRQQRLVTLAQAQVRASHQPFDQPQLMVVVDRNPAVQQAAIVLARAEGPWEVLGATHVSTGQPGRFDHYITPTGVFLHTADILGYRADGTYNENHIRGLGVKGMRVWDFGWQVARKGWRADGETGPIRLEMHATDPDVLAQRIGRPASQGCIRIPDALDRFLDRHGVLDADYERAATLDRRYRALLLPDRVPSRLAGHALIVVDSSARS